MCIRDRANPSSASSIPGNLFIFGGCTGTTSGIGCSSYSSSCLLYTSDAADERSRVDLGGGRIIKKKHIVILEWIGDTTNKSKMTQ